MLKLNPSSFCQCSIHLHFSDQIFWSLTFLVLPMLQLVFTSYIIDNDCLHYNQSCSSSYASSRHFLAIWLEISLVSLILPVVASWQLSLFLCCFSINSLLCHFVMWQIIKLCNDSFFVAGPSSWRHSCCCICRLHCYHHNGLHCSLGLETSLPAPYCQTSIAIHLNWMVFCYSTPWQQPSSIHFQLWWLLCHLLWWLLFVCTDQYWHLDLIFGDLGFCQDLFLQGL
jgi:hypothetical protein